MPASDDTLQMRVATLPSTIFLELNVVRPRAIGPVKVVLDNAKTSLLNESVIYTTSGETDFAESGKPEVPAERIRRFQIEEKKPV